MIVKATRTRFRFRMEDEAGNCVATSISVDVPTGLTREQAADYVAGRVAGEVRRYAAYECLGLTCIYPDTDWREIVT